VLFRSDPDAAGPSSGGSGNEDAITTFKQQFGGIMEKRGVTIILATNYPMQIEGAIRSRLAAGCVEIGLPDEAARRAMIEFEINKAFGPSLLKSDRYVMERDRVVAYIANRTRPPFLSDSTAAAAKKRYRAPTRGEQPGRKRGAAAAAAMESDASDDDDTTVSTGLWSGRDLKALVIFAMSRVRSRFLAENSTVKQCSQAIAGSEDCKNYNVPSNEPIYVPSKDGRVLLVRDVIREGKGARIQPAPVTLEDFVAAFSQYAGSVDAASVRSQVRFNAERGFRSIPDTDAARAAQNWTNWFCAKQGGGGSFNPGTTYPSLGGANTTVPVS